MTKRSFEFDTLFSDVEQGLEERKNRIRTKPIKFKVCKRCGETKPVFKFSADKRNSDKKIGVCKICRSWESLEYYYQNRDKILIRVKEYQETNRKDRSVYFKDYQREHEKHLKKIAGKWYKKNKKAIKKRNLKYYNENKEACLAIRELWREKNKERIKKYNREYTRKHKVS